MQVKLVSYSQVPVFEHNTNKLTEKRLDITEQVAYAARVSNPANQMNNETSEKLIRYLIKNQHWSPFEMAHITLEIETTRDIARQILRHRSFSFQEFSQRYADPTQMEFVTREARLQDTKNRQNSIEVDNAELQNDWYHVQRNAIENAKASYQWALTNGIAKEQARAVLPEGLTGSRLYMAGTLRSWIHYIEIRTDKATQKEHREVAVACSEEIKKIFPMIIEFVDSPETI